MRFIFTLCSCNHKINFEVQHIQCVSFSIYNLQVLTNFMKLHMYFDLEGSYCRIFVPKTFREMGSMIRVHITVRDTGHGFGRVSGTCPIYYYYY
jgi:hypothetical protein